MTRTIAATIGLTVIALLSACATGVGGDDYSRDQTRREQTVRLGVVDSVREVKIEGTRSGVGAVAGGAVGGVAGSTVGQGRGSTVGAVLGGVAGGVAGQAAEQGATRQTGLEITVKLDSGKLIAVTQAAGESFKPGDRVRVLSDGATTRVTH
jgi:outer membrane lipoprotein SlyB